MGYSKLDLQNDLEEVQREREDVTRRLLAKIVSGHEALDLWANCDEKEKKFRNKMLAIQLQAIGQEQERKKFKHIVWFKDTKKGRAYWEKLPSGNYVYYTEAQVEALPQPKLIKESKPRPRGRSSYEDSFQEIDDHLAFDWEPVPIEEAHKLANVTGESIWIRPHHVTGEDIALRRIEAKPQGVQNGDKSNRVHKPTYPVFAISR